MTELGKFPRRNGLGRLLTLLFCPKGICRGFLIGCDFHAEGEFNYCTALDGSSMCIRFGRCRLRHFYKLLRMLDDALFSKRNDFRYIYDRASDCLLLRHCSGPVEASCVSHYRKRINGKGGFAS